MNLLQYMQSAYNFLYTSVNWQTLTSLVTALTAVILSYLTWILAKETKVLSRATAQASITVTLEPNLWAMHWVDIHVANTGNATAFDIGVKFEPPLPILDEGRPDRKIPLQNISVLRPGQSIKSNLCENSRFKERSLTVAISWKQSPSEQMRESIEYTISLGDYDGLAQLGAANPFLQMAEQMKKLREDWQPVARGTSRVGTNVHTSQDRENEERERREIYEEMRRAAGGEQREP